MSTKDEAYRFKDKRIVVTYDPDTGKQPTSLRFMYDDWLPMETIRAKRRLWVIVSFAFGLFAFKVYHWIVG